MKRKSLILLMFTCVVVSFLSKRVVAQEKSAGPINRYVREEGGGLANDFIVEFLIPESSSWKIKANGDKEKKVLGRSSISAKSEGNKIRITITTGQRARKSAFYFGNIHEWANALTIYYTPPPKRPR